MNKDIKNEKGALAIVIILGTATIALILMLSVNKIIINLAQNSRGFKETAHAFFAAESCLQETSLQLKKNKNYTSIYTETNPLELNSKANCFARITKTDQTHGKIESFGKFNDKIRSIVVNYSIINNAGPFDNPNYNIIFTTWQEQ